MAAISDPSEILSGEVAAFPLRQAFRSGQIDAIRSVSQLPAFVWSEIEAREAQQIEDANGTV